MSHRAGAAGRGGGGRGTGGAPVVDAPGRHVRLTSDHFWMACFRPPGLPGSTIRWPARGSRSVRGLSGAGAPFNSGVLWLAFAQLSSQVRFRFDGLAEAETPAPQRGDRRWLHHAGADSPVSWWLRNPVERASFLLTAAYLLRDRDMKLRLYPALAPMVIMPVIFLMRDTGEARAPLVGLRGSYLALLPS